MKFCLKCCSVLILYLPSSAIYVSLCYLSAAAKDSSHGPIFGPRPAAPDPMRCGLRLDPIFGVVFVDLPVLQPREREIGEGADFIVAASADDPAHIERSGHAGRSEEHTSELQSLMRISYAVFCL